MTTKSVKLESDTLRDAFWAGVVAGAIVMTIIIIGVSHFGN